MLGDTNRPENMKVSSSTVTLDRRNYDAETLGSMRCVGNKMPL